MMNDLAKRYAKALITAWVIMTALLLMQGCGVWDEVTGMDEEEPIYRVENNSGPVVIGDENVSNDSEKPAPPEPTATPTADTQ